MKAELIAVGSERLRVGRRDTNGDWLTIELSRAGVEVIARGIVEDDVDAIATQLRTATDRAQIVIVTGGLGPTSDDRTRSAFSDAFGLPLEHDPAIENQIKNWFESRGRSFTDIQRSQASRPAGAEWIQNSTGTAPGFLLRHKGCVLVALPGVPTEMMEMFSRHVTGSLLEIGQSSMSYRRIRIAGLTESRVEERIRDLYGTGNVDTTILSGAEGIELHLRAIGGVASETQARVEHVANSMRERLAGAVYGDGDSTLAEVVGELLSATNATLATAESCTAGKIAAMVTDVPGSSRWFLGGWVVYSDRLKVALAGIEPELLAEHGAVSEFVARRLAESVRDRCNSTFGIGVTGIAGPEGGSMDKPVGLVHVALACDRRTEHWKTRLVGDRAGVRDRATTFALDQLRRRILEDRLADS